jgi:hypothetical protein
MKTSDAPAMTPAFWRTLAASLPATLGCRLGLTTTTRLPGLLLRRTCFSEIRILRRRVGDHEHRAA